MHSYCSSTNTDDIDRKYIEELNGRIEVLIERIKSTIDNGTITHHLRRTVRLDLCQRFALRNNYYHRKYPVLLRDLSVIKSNKKSYQLIEKQHHHSVQFYKKVFNIQSITDSEQCQQQLEQSVKFLNELKTNVSRYEADIQQLKGQLTEQNNQIILDSNNLFQIQYERSQLQSDIEQLKRKLLLEKQFYQEFKQLTSDEENLSVDQNVLNLQESSLEQQQGTLDTNGRSLVTFNQFHTEYLDLSIEMTQMKENMEQRSRELSSLQLQLDSYRTKLHGKRSSLIESRIQSLLAPTAAAATTKTQEVRACSVPLITKVNEKKMQSELTQLPIESSRQSELSKFKSRKKRFSRVNMPKHQTATLTTSRSYSVDVSTTNSEQSLGPNLQSRLEALEAAMGVRLNLAKGQGRHSLSNTTSPSPMQLSPTSIATTTAVTNSLSTSSRHNIPTRTGQGVQRSASSCDVENRPGPIKRLKPSLPTENSFSSSASASTAASIATVKKYPPPVRRPVIIPNPSPIQSKQSTPIKQRSSPMDTSSPRLSRSSTTSHNSSSNSSNYRTPIGGISPKNLNSPSPKQTIVNSPPRPPMPISRKQRPSIFGEQFSDDILKINLLWIDLKELDDESRAEVICQFGSIENFRCEQNLFFTKQHQQFKLAAKNKTITNRSRFQYLIPKKDRLELL